MSEHNHSWDLDRLLQITRQWEIPIGTSKEEAWERFLQQAEQQPTSANVTSFPLYKKYVYGIAASLVLLTAVYFIFFHPGTMSVVSMPGQHLTHILPDNSEVTLNAGSSLEYRPSGFSQHRSTVLEGEAFFDVEEGNTFEVVTDFAEVRVLGTSFNIFSRESRLEIACISGKVEVVVKEPGFTTQLEKGQRIMVRNGELITEKNIDLEKTVAWKTGEYYFNRAPLKEVMEELERQFKIIIRSDKDLRGRYYSGYFTNKDLPEALKLVFLPMGLQYKQHGDTVEVQ